MSDGHGPEGLIVKVRPVERCMNHHGPSLGDNDANGTLSNTVLPLGTHPTEADGLGI